MSYGATAVLTQQSRFYFTDVNLSVRVNKLVSAPLDLPHDFLISAYLRPT